MMKPIDAREERRKARNLKAHLTSLTSTVLAGLAEIDKLGARKDLPDDIGRRLAKIANAMEMANDKARYFGLGVDWRKDTKGRPTAGHADRAGAARGTG